MAETDPCCCLPSRTCLHSSLAELDDRLYAGAGLLAVDDFSLMGACHGEALGLLRACFACERPTINLVSPSFRIDEAKLGRCKQHDMEVTCLMLSALVGWHGSWCLS